MSILSQDQVLLLSITILHTSLGVLLLKRPGMAAVENVFIMPMY